MTAQTHGGGQARQVAPDDGGVVHVDPYLSARFTRVRRDLLGELLALLVGLAVMTLLGAVAAGHDAFGVLDTYGRWAWFVAGGVAAVMLTDLADMAGRVRRSARALRLTRREAVEALRAEMRLVQVRSDLPAGMTCVEDIAEARGLRWMWGGGR